MMPVLWDTGGEVSRHPPYGESEALRQMLASLVPLPPRSPPTTARSD
jgi:hypothetical protein